MECFDVHPRHPQPDRGFVGQAQQCIALCYRHSVQEPFCRIRSTGVAFLPYRTVPRGDDAGEAPVYVGANHPICAQPTHGVEHLSCERIRHLRELLGQNVPGPEDVHPRGVYPPSQFDGVAKHGSRVGIHCTHQQHVPCV